MPACPYSCLKLDRCLPACILPALPVLLSIGSVATQFGFLVVFFCCFFFKLVTVYLK